MFWKMICIYLVCVVEILPKDVLQYFPSQPHTHSHRVDESIHTTAGSKGMVLMFL